MTRIPILLLTLLAVASIAVAAGPAYWDSPGRIPFTGGELHGAALDARGSLVPGLVAETVMADSALVFWSADVATDGGFFVGSGHDGLVWRVDEDGDAALLADLGAEEIFTVLADGDGVLAGCGAGGQLYRVDRRGEASLLGTVDGGFIWDLQRAPDGAVYLATGTPATIYRLDDGQLEQVVELPASNALDVAVMDDGTLLVATQGPGRVFHVRPRARQWALALALDQDEGRQLVQGPDGWYALGYQEDAQGSNGNGNGNGNGGDAMDLDPFDIMVTADASVEQIRAALYRVTGGTPVRVWSSERVITRAAWSDDHGWLGAGERVQGGPTTLDALVLPNDRRPLASWEGGDVLGLILVAGDRGPDEVVAVQAHPGRVTRLRPAGKGEAVAMSAPLDGRLPVRWGRLNWRGPAGGDEPRFAVRVGNSPVPDEAWIDWIDLGHGHDLDLAKVQTARCLQWRVTLPAGSRVDAVSVSGAAPNVAPQITHFQLEPDAAVYQGGMMQSPEQVTQRFADGLQVEYNLQSRRDRRVDHARADALRPLRALTWLATDANADRLDFQVFHRRQGDETWVPMGPPTVEQVRLWDTAALADGWYDVRLVASDRPANPVVQALAVERVLGPVPVDNTPPVVSDWSLQHHREGFTATFAARDAFGPLAGAEVVLPDGSIERLDPADGICDGAREAFAVDVRYPRDRAAVVPRPWSVTVRVWDLQGNVAQTVGVLP